MVHLIENEAAVMDNRPSINLFSRCSGLAVYSQVDWKMAFQQSENEIAGFLTKTERKESKNTQNILLDGWYRLLRSIWEKKNLYVNLYPETVPRPEFRRK